MGKRARCRHLRLCARRDRERTRGLACPGRSPLQSTVTRRGRAVMRDVDGSLSLSVGRMLGNHGLRDCAHAQRAGVFVCLLLLSSLSSTGPTRARAPRGRARRSRTLATYAHGGRRPRRREVTVPQASRGQRAARGVGLSGLGQSGG